MMRKIIAAAGLVALSAVAAHAATATGNLSVSVTITASCAVTNGTLSFGSNAASALSAIIDASGSFLVNCTTNAPYSVTLGNGANFSSGRRMSDGGTNYVNYDIYTSAARTTSWSGATAVTGTGSGADQTINVYGRIPSGQSVPTGSYSDTVGITVTY